MYWSPHTRDAVVPTEAAAVGRTSTALRKRSCTSLNRGEQQEAPRQRFAACRCRRQHQNVLLLSCTFAAREATRAAHRRPSEAASGAHQRAASARGRRRRRGSSVRSGPRYKVEACIREDSDETAAHTNTRHGSPMGGGQQLSCPPIAAEQPRGQPPHRQRG
jgi:hypothetical protein